LKFSVTLAQQFKNYLVIRYQLLWLALLAISRICAQDGCVYEPSGKIQKLLDQSFDMKKYETNERIEFLEKALDEDPKCTPCLMRLGEIEFKVAKRGGSFASAKQRFLQLDELCPNYHSEVYYFLGAMCYADREYEKALDFFEKFLRFPDSDPSKFEKDYQKKYTEVEEALTSIRAYAEIYKNPIDFKPVRVAGVSSSTDDYLPLISPDGEIMFFTRTVNKQAKGDLAPRTYEHFSWCKRPDINTHFDEGTSLPEPFNQGANCGGATITVDNRELIVAMKNPNPKNPDNIDLFSTRYNFVTNDVGQRVYQWGPLESLGDLVNTPDGFEGQPTLSGDGQTLYFVGVRPECVKDANGNFSHDIFFSKRAKDGSWGKAQLIGGGINTAGQEKGPFMHSDSKSLYFASDGHIGVGKMDLYFCKVQDDGSIKEIKNIGYPINSEADELGIVVTSDGELAYFGAKNFQSNKGWDVYEFKMPETAKPEKVMVVKGQVKTSSGVPPAQAKVEINYTESKKKEEVAVNQDDGTYAAVVKMSRNENVTLSVEGDDIAFNSRVIAKKDDPAPVVTKLNMETQEAKANEAVVINDIYYSTNSADIEERSKIILDAFADYLKDHPGMVIEISGHTDSRGDDNANKALSAERAFEVMKYLVDHGVEAKRLTYQGYGESKPVGDNNTEEGRSMNRRTEFVIKKM
jgi:outer membrane protein OmpA-like peptidoglycan-associated protein/tetratricopeptide (TPR) repeat protein